ncbi:MAG: glutamate racemase [Bacteroidales bacterium]|nr:glutamate racemase [Bacteroidales bacterium]
MHDCASPIGVFDSGYGGLTILQKIRQHEPDCDYVYLGDNARTPYGSRSFEIVYQFTLQAVRRLFEEGCPIVILACNTASAKALRTIQQCDLPGIDPTRRVLGVIRPTVEAIGSVTRNHHVGVLATQGTIASNSYPLEIAKLYPHIRVSSQACPMWVPLVENHEHQSLGASYFVKKYIDELLQQDPDIDTVVLGCTHYPLLYGEIRRFMPSHIQIIAQGDYVAHSLSDYLHRHQDMHERISRQGSCRFLTTEQADRFRSSANLFLSDSTINVETITLQ